MGPDATDELTAAGFELADRDPTDRDPTDLDPTDLDPIDLTDLDRFERGFPHRIFTRLRREAPVWFHPPTEHTPGAEGFWVVSRHADVLAVAGDSATFSSAGGGGRVDGGTLIEDLPAGFAAGVLLNMMDDPRHQRIRKLITPTLSPRALAELESDLARRCDTILDTVIEEGRCDLLTDVAAELPLQAVANLLGVPQEDRHLLFGWANATLDYDHRQLGEQDDAAARASAEMFAYGSALLTEKRRCPGDDILSLLAAARIPPGQAPAGSGATGAPGASAPADEPLTELEQQMFFNLLIAAGSETTRNSIAIGLLALMAHPDQWSRLQTDRSLLPSAVEEILRYASTTAYNRRTATADTNLGDQAVAAGDKVTLWWSSANRDESVFDDPFRFDVGRSPNRHLAFGHGSHFCLGANLARLEIRLVLGGLLDRASGVELTGPVEWTRSNKHTGVRRMPVAFAPR